MSGGLVIAFLSLIIGVVSDATELRFAFGGVAVLGTFGLGIFVCLGLLRTLRGDLTCQQALVAGRVGD